MKLRYYVLLQIRYYYAIYASFFFFSPLFRMPLMLPLHAVTTCHYDIAADAYAISSPRRFAAIVITIVFTLRL